MDVGHNRPPSQIEFANQTATDLGYWLANCPVVETEEQARAGKLLVDRARLCLADMEDERKGRVRPLQAQVKAIDDEYRSPKSILDKILTELKDRLNVWIKKEEEKRLKAAEEARKAVEEAEKIARDAEERELEACDDARHGIVDTENALVERVRQADAAFTAYQAAEREAARAEKDTTVRVGGGFSRSLSTRFKEELFVSDAGKAVAEMGWSERLVEALKTDAREFRRQHGKLPEGIIAQGERRL